MPLPRGTLLIFAKQCLTPGLSLVLKKNHSILSQFKVFQIVILSQEHEERSQAGPKGHQLEVGAPKLLVFIQ